MQMSKEDEEMDRKITLMVSSIKNPWVRRAVIIGAFPFMAALALAFNLGAIAYLMGAIILRLVVAVFKGEIAGIPVLLETARRVW